VKPGNLFIKMQCSTSSLKFSETKFSISLAVKAALEFLGYNSVEVEEQIFIIRRGLAKRIMIISKYFAAT
jgi:hypothetical protein